MNESLLDQAIATCKQDPTPDNRKRAIDALGIFLYENLQKYRLSIRDEDTRSDFIVWLYPRFGGMIDRFNPERASFGTFLNWNVRLTFRSFCRSRYGTEARQRVYEAEEETRIRSEMAEQENSGIWELYAGEPFPGPRAKDSANASRKRREIEARTLLLLACKAGYEMDDATIESVSRRTGLDAKTLRARVDLVRRQSLHCQDRLRLSREREYRYYLRASRCLYEMGQIDKATNRYQALERERAYCQRRIASIRDQIKRQQKTPSNRFLAKTLGFCRGTVDSTLAAAAQRGYSGVS